MAAPVSYVNDIARVSQIDNFISINGAVDIDLYGQVSSESSGIHHISGAGGQQDFVMGAYLSKGGKSFICCSSSYMDKKSGQLKSRIRPTLLEGSVVTATRTNLHYVVTEYGKFNAKGKSTWDCHSPSSVPRGVDRRGGEDAHLAPFQQEITKSSGAGRHICRPALLYRGDLCLEELMPLPRVDDSLRKV